MCLFLWDVNYVLSGTVNRAHSLCSFPVFNTVLRAIAVLLSVEWSACRPGEGTLICLGWKDYQEEGLTPFPCQLQLSNPPDGILYKNKARKNYKKKRKNCIFQVFQLSLHL